MLPYPVETAAEAALVQNLPKCVVLVPGRRAGEFAPRAWFTQSLLAILPCYLAYEKTLRDVVGPRNTMALLVLGTPTVVQNVQNPKDLEHFWARVLAVVRFDAVPYRLTVSADEASDVREALQPLGVADESPVLTLDELSRAVARFDNIMTAVILK